MPFIQALTRLIRSNGQAVTENSNILNVIKDESVLDKKDLTSDKLILLSGIPSDKFYFVAGDKLLIRKYTSPEVLSSVINITKTGWYTYNEFAPAGMKTTDYQNDRIGYGYYIEPKEYTGDRYYGGSMVSLMRISSIKFCSRFIHCGSPLAPAGIQDQFSALIMWGEVDAQGNSALKIPAHLEDMSGLFDMGMTIDTLLAGVALPKIITLGKPKKMHRTFYNAFSYGMFTYSPPVDAVVFGEMDVSEVTDFSYCFGQCFQANPDVENWNVSSATNMTGMFGIVVDWTTDKWTRNLSGWCVSKITSEPANFALNHPMTAAQKPVWGTCLIKAPTVVAPMGYYNAAAGGSVVSTSRTSNTIYMRFTLSNIRAGTVLTLRAGPHGTPRDGYYTDFTVLKANGAIDSSNGVKTRMYGDGVPNKDITLTFTQAVTGPVEFVVGVNIWNYIYTMDKYGTGCTNYVYCNGVVLASAYLELHW